MWHLDWRFLPVFDQADLGQNYLGVYEPALVATSVVIAILAAFVALSISGRIAAAHTGLSRWAWTSAGAVVMGGGIWAMHFVGMLAFSLPCGVGYDPVGTVLSMIPGAAASGVALSVIGRRELPGLLRLTVGAVLMGAGIGMMHYSGMAAMRPEALLRYDPAWAGVSVVVAVALAFISLSIRFRFHGANASSTATTLIAAAVMGCAVAGMHYTAMRAALFYPLPSILKMSMALAPMTLAVLITIITVLVASVTLVASFAGRQAELALTLRAEIAERERSEVELIKARREAEEGNRAKSVFLATMSHEIRTPLNGVIGMANLLASTPLNARQVQLVENLAKSGRSLLVLINDILDFSRVEAHELELFEAPFAPREVVAEIIDMFTEQCHSKGLDIVYSVADEVPAQLLGDAVRLRQILINLVGNATKFTERGEIVIELSQAGETEDSLTLAVSVRDTGIGIPAEKLDGIFEPFRQADASMTRSYGGSGLGLSITKHLVGLMAGEIGVESTPGRGSHFHFTARLRRTADAIAAPAARCIERTLRVLLVDTNAASARITRQHLSRWKIKPTLAGTGKKAKAVWQRAIASGTPFDVVIVDIKGLGSDGIDLARLIRTEGRNYGTEIVLLVGMTDVARNDDIEAIGAFATFTKPARPSALFDCFAAIASGGASKGIASLVARRGGRGIIPSFAARILVVEDNPVNQEVVTGTLETMGCQTTTASNGKCAVERFAEERFDLVLMDCEMPVMDGFEATRRIREIEAATGAPGGSERKRTPILALTAHALAEIREKCLRSGMDDFLVKPFDEVQLGERLRRWIPALEGAPRVKGVAPLAAAETAAVEPQPIIDTDAVERIRAIPGKHGASLLARVVAQFGDTAPPLAAAIRTHCEKEDTEAVWRAAHSLKSSAAAVGAIGVSRRCAEIEALARASGTIPETYLLDALDADLATARARLEELAGVEYV
jgi:signal transduction histidine kinase/CheY-like chemotaxis protein/HPt (histidine-containing phosphotransfer) domain-containing protein